MTASVLVGTADTTPTSSYNYSTVAHASTTVITPRAAWWFRAPSAKVIGAPAVTRP